MTAPVFGVADACSGSRTSRVQRESEHRRRKKFHGGSAGAGSAVITHSACRVVRSLLRWPLRPFAVKSFYRKDKAVSPTASAPHTGRTMGHDTAFAGNFLVREFSRVSQYHSVPRTPPAFADRGCDVPTSRPEVVWHQLEEEDGVADRLHSRDYHRSQKYPDGHSVTRKDATALRIMQVMHNGRSCKPRCCCT